MTWTIYHISPDGLATPIDTVDTQQEADEQVEYLSETRNAAECIDGTSYEAREELGDVDSTD